MPALRQSVTPSSSEAGVCRDCMAKNCHAEMAKASQIDGIRQSRRCLLFSLHQCSIRLVM
jgi:hypothetical protein